MSEKPDFSFHPGKGRFCNREWGEVLAGPLTVRQVFEPWKAAAEEEPQPNKYKYIHLLEVALSAFYAGNYIWPQLTRAVFKEGI